MLQKIPNLKALPHKITDVQLTRRKMISLAPSFEGHRSERTLAPARELTPDVLQRRVARRRKIAANITLQLEFLPAAPEIACA